jgi:uncharacterized protein YggE
MKAKMISVLLGAFISAQLFAQALPSTPYVVVQGHAERTLAPDRFDINITVQTTSMSVSEASALVESKTSLIVQSLKALGLKPAQITATNISINPEYRYDNQSQKNTFIGNQVNRNISAKFHDKKSLQKFLAEIPAGETIRVSGISTSLSTQATVEAELLDAAAVDAKKQALDLLDKFGLKIIGIHTISQNIPSIGFESGAMYKRSMSDMVAAAPPPLGDTMEAGMMTVNKDVYVVYLISAK